MLMELADDLNNGAYVIGAANTAWQQVRYAEQAIALRWHDGAKTTGIATGDGRPILDGDPVAAVVLLANLAGARTARPVRRRHRHDRQLHRRGWRFPGPGAIEADFGSLGQ